MEPSTEYGREVAHRIAAAIEAADLTQRAIADLTGIPLTTLNRKLNGHVPFNVIEVKAISLVVGESSAATFLPDVA